MSAKTGVAPAWRIALVVAGHVNEAVEAVVVVRGAGRDQRQVKAVVQDEVAIACGAPTYAANRCSSSLRPPLSSSGRSQRLGHRLDLLVAHHGRRERGSADGRAAIVANVVGVVCSFDLEPNRCDRRSRPVESLSRSTEGDHITGAVDRRAQGG